MVTWLLQIALYALEALSLLCNISIALSEKQAHDLKWNRTCNPHGRLGGNKPSDLHMEHMNRSCKDNISTFAPHISPTSVQKTAHAAPIMEECIANFDHHMNILCPPTTRTDIQSFNNLWKQEHANMFLRELTHSTRIAVAIYAVK